jgi:hypothetical protein
MEKNNYKFLNHKERIKSVTDLAFENNMSSVKVLEVYNKFNSQMYINNNDNSLYNPILEEASFALTKLFLTRLN